MMEREKKNRGAMSVMKEVAAGGRDVEACPVDLSGEETGREPSWDDDGKRLRRVEEDEEIFF